MQKLLVSTGGGDCPGLNAVIRGITKAAKRSGGWEVWGSMEAFNGLLQDPPDLMHLTTKKTAGIHVKGGTILKTTNRGNPLAFPVLQEDGSYEYINRCGDVVSRIRELGFDALINIGGDGSQRISQGLMMEGLNVVGVPKTIDNDLDGTDITFGFSTAVQIATECLDKLVTTAESHHRVMIMEVMGRDAGWIALHTAIAGGAEICLLPEIPYDIDKIVKRINKRYHKRRGFVNIVIAEGAKPLGGEVVGRKSADPAAGHIKLGGIGEHLRWQLETAGCLAEVRSTTLGHIQRGGTPIAYDRVLATAMGVEAFELVHTGRFGRLVALRGDRVDSVPLQEAVQKNKFVDPEHYLLKTARAIGISFGD